jgi:hypothetical protein
MKHREAVRKAYEEHQAQLKCEEAKHNTE